MTSSSNLNQANQENKLDLRPNTHSFDVDLAKDYGIDIAIMLKHINYLVNLNKNLNRNFHDGRYWFYNTLDEIVAHFEYWSRDQMNRLLRKMVDMKLILKGNFNKTSFDRTLWYTINCQIDMAKSPNGNGEIATPIPNTNTNKESISKDIPKKDANASTLTSNSKEKLIERSMYVQTTDREHKKLLEKHGEEVRDWSYKKLSEWKQRTPKRDWKKNDYLTIIAWVINAYKEHKFKEQKFKGFSSVDNHKEIANKITRNFKEKAASKKIEINSNSTAIAFIFTEGQRAPVTFKYLENGFEEQVNSFMRKYKLI